MPLVFITTGALLIITALKGSPSDLYALLKYDFWQRQPHGFVYWFIAIVVLGSLGYIPSLKSLSRMFLILVLVVLLLENKGFFAQLQSFIKSAGGKAA